VDEQELLGRLNEYYGSEYKPDGNLTIRGEKLFLYTGGATKLHALWRGLHIANTDLSLTIEGAQLFGKTAKKNTVIVSKEQAEKYYCGEDLSGFVGSGFVLIKTRQRPIGCGRIEDGRIVNILPGSRTSGL